MSHFTYMTTKMVELDFIKSALEDMGFEWEEGRVTVRGFMNNKQPAQLKISSVKRGYDIGFRKSGDTYQILADWGMLRMDGRKFAKHLAQRYAYHATREKLEAQGFETVTEETTEDGEIRLVLRRAVF